MIRTFRIVIFDSGDEAPIHITGVENFIVVDALLAQKLVELVIKGVQRHNIKINDSEFDVLAFHSNRWLDMNEDIQKLLEKDTVLILVSKKVKKWVENEYGNGNDTSFYLGLTELELKLREKENQDIIVNMAKSLNELVNIIKEMDNDTIDILSKIIEFRPNLMGIGVNLNELYKFLKRLLRKRKERRAPRS